MSNEIRAEIKAAAKALCHYPLGPSAVNSCCPGIGRCEMDAAITEIARLRAELATARREGMDQLERYFRDAAAETPLGYEDHQRGASVYNWLMYCATTIAAIRAAAKEEK